MPKTKISEFDVDPANNTDINSINIAEGCAPSGINNAIRQLMSDLKEFQTGAGGDPFNGAVNGTVGATTPASGAFTTLSASGAFSANGGATLGDASGDALTINSSAVSIPNGLNFDSNTFVIDATNNRVGIGTSSPLQKLGVEGAGDTRIDVKSTDENPVSLQLRTSHTSPNNNNWSITAGSGGTRNLVFTDNLAGERMRIDSSGNVGIGTSSPQNNSTFTTLTVDGTNSIIEMRRSGSRTGRFYVDSTGTTIGAYTATPLMFITNDTERARITAAGRFCVNTTVGTGNEVFAVWYNSSGGVNSIQGINILDQGSASGSPFMVFRKSDEAGIGTITRNGTSNAVLYNTTSDYRLKEEITPMSGALERVAKLKPVTWKWKDSVETGEGFIAHEVQEVVPSAVSGEKDAVDEKGKPAYQGMDASYLVATLTAAIQEQQAIITDLKARIEAIESK